MKNKLIFSCAFLLGATLAVGCGGAAMEDMEDSQTPVAVETAPVGEEEQVSSGEMEEDRPVGDVAACCFVACRDGAWDRWRGPFRNVKYGNCDEYGRYYCGQHKWRFKAAKWDDC